MNILKHLLEGRYRISTQLYLGIGGAVVLTMGASLVGWFSFNSVGDAQSRVNEGSVPGMAAAFGVAQQSSAIVAAAPRLIAAATPETFDQVIAEIATERNTFEAQLAALTQQGEEEERFSRIRAQGNTLISKKLNAPWPSFLCCKNGVKPCVQNSPNCAMNWLAF